MTDSSRRRFLERSIKGLLTTAVAGLSHRPGEGLGITNAIGSDAKRRRHLINFTVGAGEPGAWDSSWSHNATALEKIEGLPGSVYAAAGLDPSKVRISRALNGFDMATYADASLRYTVKQEQADQLKHPDGLNTLGLTFKHLYSGANQSLLNDVLIWKGLNADGGHRVGNNLLLHGTASSYAVSYPALVAQGLASTDEPKILHYVMIAASPAELFTNVNTNTGYALPICIPDLDQLKAITSVDPHDFPDSQRRAVIDAAVRKLSGVLLRDALKFSESRTQVASFSRAFDDSVTLSAMDFAGSWEFASNYARFALALAEEARRFVETTAGQIRARFDWGLGAGGLAYLTSGLDTLISKLTTALAASSPGPLAASEINALMATHATGQLADLVRIAYVFSLSDFLVRTNRSAVVDAGVPYFDYHKGYVGELLHQFLIMAGFRQLVSSLKAATLADGSSLLDSTQVLMQSEMDRDQFHNVPLAGAQPGTDHGHGTMSLLAAGYGLKAGVMGGIAEGPEEAARFQVPVFSKLPIDWSTGKPLVGGQFVYSRSLLPTVLSSFGFSRPLRQQTEYGPVPGLLKT
jgi:hypothetical protein